VVDPTAEEETCSIASVVTAITEKSLVTSVFKTGAGSFHPQTLVDIFKVCVLN
jgi:exosome complex RNA-binding protein Rrp42 (RNase PH superfamily)